MNLENGRYCYRLILNEALSFGVLGATGRGLTEMHGVDVNEVEVLTLSMAHSLASVGGLCIGTTQVCILCFHMVSPPYWLVAMLMYRETQWR